MSYVKKVYKIGLRYPIKHDIIYKNTDCQLVNTYPIELIRIEAFTIAKARTFDSEISFAW